jgi:hypothetical protein
MSYYNYWQHKGHTYSECHWNENIQNIYVPIPKNASTNIRAAIKNSDFQSIVFLDKMQQLKPQSTVVVLRDPIDRWISGITTYLNLYVIKKNNVLNFLKEIKKDKNFLDLLFEKITFDDHTEKQIYFLQPFDKSQCTFFYIDDKIEFRLTQFYLGEGLKISFDKNHMNHRKNDPVHEFFTTFLFDAYNHNYMEKLKEHFREDYNLISQTKFYGI